MLRIISSLLLLSMSLPAAALAPLYNVAPPSAEQIAQASHTNGPAVFAFSVAKQLDPSVDGAWTSNGDSRSWQARLQAPGANSMSLLFDEFELPSGAQLQILDADGQPVHHYDATAGRKGRLFSGLIWGDTLGIRLLLPHAEAPYRLKLSALNYGFQAPQQAMSKHGSCNYDTACPIADNWQDQVDATVMVVIDGTGVCSGTLVNNTRRDLTPYVLTADHCGIDVSNDDSVVAYWRFERSSCQSPASGHGDRHNAPDPRFSISGSEWLAAHSLSDFTLLVMGSKANPIVPPNSFQPYWSGLDFGLLAASSGAGVHHPNGDEKSIAIFNQAARSVRARIEDRAEPDIEAWEVVWAEGTTEPGSSGSGLWNQDQRLVGVLSGGDAACTNPSGTDLYGRMNYAWDQEQDCSAQLEHWLNPVQALGTNYDGASHASATADPQIPACGTSPTPTPQPSPGNSSSNGGSGVVGVWLMILFASLLGRSRRRH